jgi:RNA polymerase sigma-32 factor
MSNTLQTLTAGLPIGSLDAYIEKVNRIPMLTETEEKSLADRFYNQGDLPAAQQLVITHLRFVVRVAKAYLGYGLALADLIQEGNIGLMKAVKRFNPALGVRLVSFAVHWIKAEIQEFVLRNWRIVKVATTKAQRKLFFNLRKMKQRLGWLGKEEVQFVADELGVTPAQIHEMEMRLSAHDVSMDKSDDDDESANTIPANYLEDNRYDPAKQFEKHNIAEQKQEKLQQALEQLDDRSQYIVKQRWLNESKATLQDLAEHYQVSAERIRQLENNAMKKLRLALGELK